MKEGLAGMDQAFSQRHLDAVRQRIASIDRADFCRRLWRRDWTLWKEDDENRKSILDALGWLDLPDKMSGKLDELVEFTSRAKAAGFRHVVHMGMGGSSLAPLAFQKMFEPGENGLPMTVLDTTDPATILDIERSVPLARTLFIEASKSGTTVESRSFGEYFYHKVKEIKGEEAGDNFAVITDPGSMLDALARERRYRSVFLNFHDIGGRYSALSYFGLVPAALMGIDVREIMAGASNMMKLCGPDTAAGENPGVILGAMLGEMALQGRNKLTFLGPGCLTTLGMWLEQLIAESTGKEGKGIVPVPGEPVGLPEVYGEDRFFVRFHLETEPDEFLDRHVEGLEEAGHPVVTIGMKNRMDIGREFYRWEIATATAGAVLRINPFDQPNVQESKDFTHRLLKQVREEGRLVEGRMDMVEGPVRMYTAGGATTVSQAVSLFLGQAREGDHLVILAYLTENSRVVDGLQAVRVRLRDRLHMATTLEFGPRYLHSTGQLHKGGTDTGLFLLLTCDDAEDMDIPGQPYTFGSLRRAQALGDFEVLRRHRRRVLRIHLDGDAGAGLEALWKVIENLPA